MPDIRESFRRASHMKFAEGFYEVFLAADERIRKLFGKTDWKTQRALLLHSLQMLIELHYGSPIGAIAMRRLAVSHGPGRLDIPRDLYPIWIEKIVETLRKTDPLFDAELEKEWRIALQKGVDCMLDPAVLNAR